MNIKLYFLCNGLSTNDIISFLNKTNNKNKFLTLSNLFKSSKKIEKDNYSKLENIGIYELLLEYTNDNVKEILNKLSNNTIYTSLDYVTIETSLVLLNNKNTEIFPLPYMSNDTNIKSINQFNQFKTMFGKYEYNNNITNCKDYWMNTKINKSFNYLNKSSLSINWKFTKNITNSVPLRTYNTKLFKKIIENIIENNKKDSYLFFCDENLIINMLKNIKNSYKYINKLTIEKGSLWEINGFIENNKLIFESYNKIYPNENNYYPLTISNNNKYMYIFKNYNFNLLNNKMSISLDMLKNIIKYTRIDKFKKNILKNLIKNNNNNDKNNDKNNKNNKTIKKNFSFNDIFNKKN
jgi:hypothetical protein